MAKYAVLCGAAPLGFMQRKIDEMYDFLVSDSGGSYRESEVMIFPNGISEAQLVFVLERLRGNQIDNIFLYICTETPVLESEHAFWLCGEEIEKSTIYDALSGVYDDGKTPSYGGRGFQVVYDSCRDFVSGDGWYYDEQVAAEGWD